MSGFPFLVLNAPRRVFLRDFFTSPPTFAGEPFLFQGQELAQMTIETKTKQTT